MATVDLSPATAYTTTLRPFANEPFVNFSAPENKRAMETALAEVAMQLGREYDLIIGGKRLRTTKKIVSTNPAKPAQVVGVHQHAGLEHVEDAMRAAQTAFQTWSRVPVAERADLLFRAAEMIRQRKFEFHAWLV